jgi:hypothetical protein
MAERSPMAAPYVPETPVLGPQTVLWEESQVGGVGEGGGRGNILGLGGVVVEGCYACVGEGGADEGGNGEGFEKHGECWMGDGERDIW